MKTVIYARVSTPKQEYTQQIHQLKEFADSKNYQVVKIFSEQLSGTKKIASRKEAQELLRFVAQEKVQLILVTEISRLGRNALDIQNLLGEFAENQVNVYFQNVGMYLLDENGNYSILTKIFLDLTASFAQMEREQLSERTKAGMAEARRKGKIIGRPQGATQSETTTLEKYPHVIKYLQRNLSLREIRQMTGVSLNTIQKVKKIYQKQNP